jgi:uncharacterized protein YdaU (DUF1376 family)
MANYWLRWVGDFQRDTGHLTCTEIGVYDRLLDHYYATETPLPGDSESCARIARAMTKDERKAVESVLKQFFTLDGGVYRQGRTDDELVKLQKQREAKSTNGKAGGRPKKNLDGTKEKPSRFPLANLAETQDESSPTPSPTKPYSVDSLGVSDISSQQQPVTQSLTPVDVFAMNHDWTPSVDFEKNLPPQLITNPGQSLRDLQEFVLYRIGTGERFTQAQWEHKYLQNLEANQKHRGQA